MENGDFLRALAALHSVLHRLCLAWVAGDMPSAQAQIRRMEAGLAYLRGLCGSPRTEKGDGGALHGQKG